VNLHPHGLLADGLLTAEAGGLAGTSKYLLRGLSEDGSTTAAGELLTQPESSDQKINSAAERPARDDQKVVERRSPFPQVVHCRHPSHHDRQPAPTLPALVTDQLADLAVDGVSASWLDEADKRALVERIRAEAARLRPAPDPVADS
jgi:hypothetical protein